MYNFAINGRPYSVNLSTLPPDITLNTFIREHAQLTATKFMCLEGGCGACICVVRGKHPVSGEQRTWAVNSCLTLLNTCIGQDIVTAEGLGDKRVGYHPIQKRLAKMNGTQCGFCSPGFVMNMYGLLESKGGQVTMNEVENAFGGNICRCTGYRPILDAMKSFASDSDIRLPADCCDIEDAHDLRCPNTGKQCSVVCRESCSPLTGSLAYSDGIHWHWPKDLAELLVMLNKVEESAPYMLVAGNTAHGVYRRSPDIKHFISVNALSELKEHTIDQGRLVLGAGLSLAEAMDVFEKVSTTQAGFEYCKQLWQHFDLIANVPVRNTGTLAGNIMIKQMHPEFPSDVFLTLEALDAKVVVQESSGKAQELPLATFVFNPKSKQVLKSFILDAYDKDKFIFKSYKVMPRAQNAHAYVNAAFLVGLDPKTSTVASARLCFGGIREDFVHADTLEKALLQRNLFDKQSIAKCFQDLEVLLKPVDILPDPTPEYRTKLACGLLYKFLLSSAPTSAVKESFRSGADMLERPLSSGIQRYRTVESNYPIGQAVNKVEGMIQCSGEATYMNDVLTSRDEVHCAFVTATKVGATIEAIDASEALKMPGVVAFYSANDIPGKNSFVNVDFDFVDEEEIFCGSLVKYFDQPLGVVAALTADQAKRAADKIKVTYTSLDSNFKLLPTMEDVFNENCVERIKIVSQISGDTLKFQSNATNGICGKGLFEMGLQYHFTMEPHTTIAVPFEDGLKVYAATQWTDLTQSVIALMLQVKAKDVQLQVRRLGGAYGCKISRGNQVSCAAALVAHKLNRPARFVQSIESMMASNGKRWACRSDYEFCVTASGKITTLRNHFYEDAGWNESESPVGGHSTSTAKSCYHFDPGSLDLKGSNVVTDAPSSTWCRAPGSVEGIAMIEHIIEHMAFEAKLDPAEVRLTNIESNNKLKQLLPEFLKTRDYSARLLEIQDFNSKNRWKKRGLGLAIMDYPIYYFGTYPATVVVYHTDGTLVITHGGIEMGQGMNTKVAQVAAHELGVDLSFIKIESSDTINGANSMVTGGAVGSESVCFAVRKACRVLNSRLDPIREKLKPAATWPEIVSAAHAKSVLLIANEQYKVGDMENYNIYGLCLTEIELDVLTGNNHIVRVDILEDAGESLSPYIDVGQVEGGFVMCLGYWLSEQLTFDRQTGRLLTNRTWNYKPPGAKDIPIDFRIELVQNPNPTSAGFMRSKATGEPPCCLAVSVIFALQQALQSARDDAGLPREWVRLGAPTTPETLVLNSGIDVTTFALS